MTHVEDYYEHIKSGKIYRKFVTEVMDATNATNGRAMALYQDHDGKLFVRDAAEFDLKFKLAADQVAAESCYKSKTLHNLPFSLKAQSLIAKTQHLGIALLNHIKQIGKNDTCQNSKS